MKNSFYSNKELQELELKSYGRNVLISRKASIFTPSEISIGNNVRIDDYCILSGKIKMGNYIHISAYTALYGRYGITLHDFSGLSPRVTVLSASDDFSGDFLIGPIVPEKFTNMKGGSVIINKYVQIGVGSVVLPSVTIGEGAAVAAMSLVNRDIEEWTIKAGIPAKFIKERTKGLLYKVREFINE